ncbi:nuclear transport factor 2 family protein [Phenylobacterium sp.]|jgi:hypothetical protein|uniref:nuclear transport factor 2 family protein n=1 Tax=Phenylobacterium sp. TaxID=1871053 RepID=UPI002F3ED9D3
MSDDVMQWAGPIASPSPAELADRHAVSQLVKVYALGIDMRAFDLVTSVFAKDAVTDSNHGVLPVGEYLPKVYAGASAWAATQHNITNQYVTLHGDEAVVWSYGIAYHWSADEPPARVVVGVQYRDRCRRFADGWLITARKVVRQWTDKSPEII